MHWKAVVQAWRALPPEEKAWRRWAKIPLNVAQSMAFEGEPVDLEELQREHACQPRPAALGDAAVLVGSRREPKG